MIKHIILNLILCCSLVFPAMAQENGEGIRFFEGTWEEALQKAKEENKLIFNQRKDKAVEEICKHVSFIK